ncbi:MAG: flagellar biosynthesis anti-sigma factor FlgM [Acidobacteria bacterium]|nr:flagellar biosynthesis anti-sigma factor FlgM [Acidobacteriota bacterium]
MKIEGHGSAHDIEGPGGAARTGAEARVHRGAARQPTESGDRVEVSAEAQLLTTAIAAAQNAPEIRTELVERMRQKLEAGEIGRDSGTLADRMIDDLLGS